MATNVAVIRGWNTLLSQYVYWSVTQILDPFLEYPSSYPSSLNVTDVCILDFNGRYAQDITFSPDIPINWSVGITDGYFVTPIDVLEIPTVIKCPSNKKPIGVSSLYNYVKIIGEVDVWCDTATNIGDNLCLSLTNNGMVSSRYQLSSSTQTPSGSGIISVGICLQPKTLPTPQKIKMLIMIGDIVYIDENMDIIADINIQDLHSNINIPIIRHF